MAYRHDFLNNQPLETIYFGGGTPSQLNTLDFSKIFESIYRIFPIADNPEITIEANPDDLSGSYINALRKLPFNRVSIGIQSFHDADLVFLKRRHSSADAVNAVRCLQDSGLSNISIDLIYGLPGQVETDWVQNLKQALSLNVPHISAYNLSYEEGTPLYDMWQNGNACTVNDETNRLLYEILTDMLTSSKYVHYEISNFAMPTLEYPEGAISRHNSSYWNGTHYLGLGPSAHSYNGICRSWNKPSMADYVKSGIDNQEFLYETETIDGKMRYNEFIITRLRTMWGVPLHTLELECGAEKKTHFLRQAAKYLQLEMLKMEDGIVKVTKKGLFVSDAILRDLIVI